MLFEHLDLKARNPYLGLAIDESLCLHLAHERLHMPFRGGLRLWTNPYAIILGRTSKMQDLRAPPPLFANEKLGFSKSVPSSYRYKNTLHPQASPPLCRRLSGGGAVLHGPGNLNYSIFLSLKAYPQMYPLRYSYNSILHILKNALQAQNIACTLAGSSDLAMIEKDGTLRKISGNAQFRRKGVLVFHGTLITRKEIITKMKKYLSHPPEEPEYRLGRKHRDFMASLPPFFDFAAFYNYFSQRVQKLLNVDKERNPAIISLSPEEKHSVYALSRRLAQKRYLDPKWILEGRSISSLNSYLQKSQFYGMPTLTRSKG